MENYHRNLSQVKDLGGGEYEHKQHFVVNEGPVLAHIKALRDNNSKVNKKGWSDERSIKFNAQIDPMILWIVEHMGCGCDYCRGRIWNLNEVKEYREFFTVAHPEYLIAPIDTGASGKIIIK
jgi:hypothetical protein